MPAPELRTASGGRSGVGGWLSGLALLGGLLLVRSVVRWVRGGRRDDGRGEQRSERMSRVDRRAVQAGHESRDAPIWPVILGGAVLVTVLGGVLITATWFQAGWVGRSLTLSPPPGLATPVPPPPPPEPRLDEVPGAQLQAVRAAEDRVLHDTAWVDRPGGVARIPIDRAIDLLTEHPPASRPADQANDVVGLPSGASSGRAPAGRAP